MVDVIAECRSHPGFQHIWMIRRSAIQVLRPPPPKVHALATCATQPSHRDASASHSHRYTRGRRKRAFRWAPLQILSVCIHHQAWATLLLTGQALAQGPLGGRALNQGCAAGLWLGCGPWVMLPRSQQGQILFSRPTLTREGCVVCMSSVVQSGLAVLDCGLGHFCVGLRHS